MQEGKRSGSRRSRAQKSSLQSQRGSLAIVSTYHFNMARRGPPHSFVCNLEQTCTAVGALSDSTERHSTVSAIYAAYPDAWPADAGRIGKSVRG
jgi:hypothetical protein